MNCEEIEQCLDAYIDDLLSPAEAARIEEHVSACDDCRETLAELRSVVEQAQDLPKSLSPQRDLWPNEYWQRLSSALLPQAPTELLVD